MTPKTSATKHANTADLKTAVSGIRSAARDGVYAGPFVTRKKIRSTIYEVAVYFSKTSHETLKDKILRLIRNEALSGEYTRR